MRDPDELRRWLLPQRVGKVQLSELVLAPPGAAADIGMLDTRERLPWAGHGASHAIPEIYERIKAAKPKTIILSGGPNSVHVEGAPRVPDGFFEYCQEAGIAVLGICYGMQVRAALAVWCGAWRGCRSCAAAASVADGGRKRVEWGVIACAAICFRSPPHPYPYPTLTHTHTYTPS